MRRLQNFFHRAVPIMLVTEWGLWGVFHSTVPVRRASAGRRLQTFFHNSVTVRLVGGTGRRRWIVRGVRRPKCLLAVLEVVG